MEKALSETINTALTAAANEAVDASIKQVFTAIVDKAVEEKVQELEQAFAAAVDHAVQEEMKKLEAVNKEAVDAKIARAVKKAELEEKIKGTNSMAWCLKSILYEETMITNLNTQLWSLICSRERNLQAKAERLYKELADLDEEQEERG